MSSLWKLLILESLKGSELGMTMQVSFWSINLSKIGRNQVNFNRILLKVNVINAKLRQIYSCA